MSDGIPVKSRFKHFANQQVTDTLKEHPKALPLSSNNSVASSYFVKQDKVPKNVIMTIRTTAEVKERFDTLRHNFGYSQSDFLDALVHMAEDLVSSSH